MAQVASIETEFGWGLLVISDRDSDLQVPDPESSTQLVFAKDDAAVIRVQHGQTGATLVRVWNSDEDRQNLQSINFGHCLLSIPTGVLVVGDVERLSAVSVALDEPGRYDAFVFGDSGVEAEVVDLLLVRSE